MRGKWMQRGAVVIVCASGALMAPAGAGAAKRPLCEDRPGRTLAVDERLRVYQTVRETFIGDVTRLFACRQGRRTTKLLERRKNNDDFRVTFLSARLGGGPFAVIHLDFETGVSAGQTLSVYDMRPGRKAKASGVSLESHMTITDYVATRSGSVAVLISGEDEPPTLVAHDAQGRRELATGATSLAAADNTVYWTEGAGTMSATLFGLPAQTAG